MGSSRRVSISLETLRSRALSRIVFWMAGVDPSHEEVTSSLARARVLALTCDVPVILRNRDILLRVVRPKPFEQAAVPSNTVQYGDPIRSC